MRVNLKLKAHMAQSNPKKQVFLAFRYGEFYGCAPKVVETCLGEGWKWVSRNATKYELENIIESDLSPKEFDRASGFYKGE